MSHLINKSITFNNSSLPKKAVASPRFIALLMSLLLGPLSSPLLAQQTDLDQKVQRFLDSHKNQWHDLNVPEMDGKILHDLILKHRYKSALEIGTSTGRSAIWMALALSKTGGKLITIEIDEGRYKEALANFAAAGVSPYIDARLADAHTLVPQLKGPFDFVFSDADKEWYTSYLKAVLPKLQLNGCFTAHNVSSGMSGIREFMTYLKSQPNLETTVDDSSGEGLSISYKRAN